MPLLWGQIVLILSGADLQSGVNFASTVDILIHRYTYIAVGVFVYFLQCTSGLYSCLFMFGHNVSLQVLSHAIS